MTLQVTLGLGNQLERVSIHTLNFHPPPSLRDWEGSTMGFKTITRLPKIIGELFFGISGNDYLCHYLSEKDGELFSAISGHLNFLPVSKCFIA